MKLDQMTFDLTDLQLRHERRLGQRNTLGGTWYRHPRSNSHGVEYKLWSSLSKEEQRATRNKLTR
jgi:hypothetical protein